jgi:TonB-dependent starch-binding outer membrane protein SusC
MKKLKNVKFFWYGIAPVLLTFAFNINVIGQGITVRGTITDAAINEPLTGVTVQVMGTMTGAISGPDGSYSVNVPAGATTLAFSFVGYVTQEIAIAGRTVIDVVMTETITALEEVVVIGYGTQQKRSVSGSVTNVTQDDFNKGAMVTATDLLKGKVAGLVITTSSGDPTAQASMRLRGTSSLAGSSEPLVVIDGVPGQSLTSVSTQEIESISVLKDASSSAIYGSRAASGVILITTKQGKANQSTVGYTGYVSFDQVSNKLDLLTSDEWRKYCEDNSINISGLDLGADTDWLGAILRTGFTHTHDLSFTGGGLTNSYRASISYQNREGILKDNDLNRFNGRLSFNQKALKDKLNIGMVTNISLDKTHPGNTGNISLAANMLPVWPIKKDDGTWYDNTDFGMGNPIRNIAYNKNVTDGNLIMFNLKGTYEIVKNLGLTVSALKEFDSRESSTYNSGQTQQGRNDQGNASRSITSHSQDLLEITSTYAGRFLTDHQVTLLAGYSWEENNNRAAQAQNRKFLTDLFTFNNLVAGENLLSGDVTSSASMYRLISFFGRLNYSFKERYILTATVRRDGSSKFGANNKWGTFPSVSVAWRLSDEPFIQNLLPVLDELKIRAGWGVAGNQTGLDPYKSIETVGSEGMFFYNGSWITAYTVNQNANPNLKWEETSMANIGVDFSFLNARIYGTLEYYDKRTSDLLYNYSVPVPPYMFSTMMANVGTMQNKGVEIMLSGDILRSKNIRWTITANGSFNKNTILKLSSEEFTTTAVKVGSAFVRGGVNTTTHILEEGRPVGQFFGWKVEGLTDAGLYNYIDVDGAAGISESDKTYIGNAQPKFTGGLENQITYKNIDLSFFFRGVFGNDLLNFSRLAGSTLQWLPGQNVNAESLSIGLKTSPVFNSFYIEKGTFVRLENLTLAYNLRNKLGFNNVRFYFTGQNLLLFTKYQGCDPEVSMDGLAPGVESRNYYPKARTYTLGLDLNF